jgi:hypothetical protein
MELVLGQPQTGWQLARCVARRSLQLNLGGVLEVIRWLSAAEQCIETSIGKKISIASSGFDTFVRNHRGIK